MQMFDLLPREILDMILRKSYILFVSKAESNQQTNADIIFALSSVDFCCFQWITSRKFKRSLWRHLKVVLKAELLNLGEKEKKTSAQPSLQERIQQLVRTLNDILRDDMERNPKIERLISQLEKENISILSSSVDKGNGIVLWIWCRSQDSLEKLHKMYESKRLEAIFKDILRSLSSCLDFINIKLWIDGSYFKRNVSVRSIASCSFGAKLKIEGNTYVYGVAKLRNQILVLCRLRFRSSRWIFMSDDENPFRLRKNMEVNEINYPEDIVSSEKENCLYVSDNERGGSSCVWKIKESDDGGHQVTKWLTSIKSEQPLTLSVASDGQLLMATKEGYQPWRLLTATKEGYQPWRLLIYGPDAELRRSIPFPKENFFDTIFYAAETSKGNFIICHEWREEQKIKGKIKEAEEEEKKEGREVKRITKSGVCEMTRDGKIIRRIIPKDGNQELNWPRHLFLDSDDRLIVADSSFNGRVILFDSDLKWNRILIPTEDGKKKGRRIEWPKRLCYDEEKKQLITGGGYNGNRAYVYSFNWK